MNLIRSIEQSCLSIRVGKNRVKVLPMDQFDLVIVEVDFNPLTVIHVGGDPAGATVLEAYAGPIFKLEEVNGNPEVHVSFV